MLTPRRPLVTVSLTMGILFAVLMVGIMSCTPTSAPAPSPTPEEVESISIKKVPCRWSSPPGWQDNILLWFVIDRSGSMFEEEVSPEEREQLYLLPDFFIQVGKLISREQVFVSIHLLGPYSSVISLRKVDQVTETLWSVERGSGVWNDYGDALEKVHGQVAGREERKIVVLLTDGTYSSEDAAEKAREEAEAKKGLAALAGEGAEVYIVLLRGGQEKLPWQDFPVTAVYEFPDDIGKLGDLIFSGCIQAGDVITAGWVYRDFSPAIQLPGYTPRVSFHFIGVHNFIEVHNGTSYILLKSPSLPQSPHPLQPQRIQGGFSAGQFQKFSAVGSYSLINDQGNCRPSPITVEGSSAYGFYMFRHEGQYAAEVMGADSVNNYTSAFTVILVHDNEQVPENCYVSPELIAQESISREDGSRFVWYPEETKGPRTIPVTASFQIAGYTDRALMCDSFTMTVRFRPEPRDNRPPLLCDGDAPPVCTSRFRFRHVPPESLPEVYLRSSTPPPPSVVEEEICQTPYPDQGSMDCPTPAHSSEEGMDYCVRAFVSLGPPPPPSFYAPVRVGIETDQTQYEITCTLRLPQSLMDHCNYEYLLFRWPDSEFVSGREVRWHRQGYSWSCIGR